AHIGQDGAGLERRGDPAADLGVSRERRADDDEVGVFHRLGRIGGDAVSQRQSSHLVKRLLAARAGDDLARQLAAAEHARQRRADEADADQRDALEARAAHWSLRKSANATTTARISSSVPMVMRRYSGRP